LMKNPNLKLLRFGLSSYLYVSKDTTEYPHKLSSLIVKERFAVAAKRPAFYRTKNLCQLILEKIPNKVQRAYRAHLLPPMTPTSGRCRQEAVYISVPNLWERRKNLCKSRGFLGIKPWQ